MSHPSRSASPLRARPLLQADEDLALALLHQIANLSTQFTGTSASDPSSVLAMQWVSEFW